MLWDLWESLLAAARSQIGGGILLASVLGSLIAYGRALPGKLFNLVVRQFTVAVDVQGSDALFAWLTRWLDVQPVSRRTRSLTAASGPPLSAFGEEPETPRILFTPAPGQHLLWYRGRPVWLSRERKEASDREGQYAGYRETYTLRVLGRSQETVRALLEEARDLVMAERRTVGVYLAAWGEWRLVRSMVPRPLESIALREGVMERLVADAAEFLASRAWYDTRGLPWRRGWLFEGPPGTGKTSTITAIAAHLRMDLYVCPVSGKEMNDECLFRTVMGVPERSFLLLEDVDAIVHGREVSTEGGITFSGLLNVLDGVGSRPGVIVVLTTNHAEALDAALVRRGRVDQREHFGLATRDQGARLFAHFYAASALSPDGLRQLAGFFGAAMEGRSTADAQAILLEHKDDPRGALESARREQGATPGPRAEEAA
jgi:chaperone BCS1